MRHTIVLTMLTIVFLVGQLAPALSQESDPLEVLQSDASHKEKTDACVALAVRGDRQAIPVLEDLLEDPELSHMARQALEAMPYAEATKALRTALEKTSGSLQVGIINSLARRGDAESVPLFISFLSAEDGQVAQEAARALGMLATPEAGRALMEALSKEDIPSDSHTSVCDGLLRYAETLAGKGHRKDAREVYDSLLQVSDAPGQIRSAAFRGAVLTAGRNDGLSMLRDAIRKGDDVVFDAALRAAREMEENGKVTEELAKLLSALPPERKVGLIQALGQRGGVAAGPAVLKEAGKGPVAVRQAALAALTRMGYEPALKLIRRIASSEDEGMAELAQDSLCYFPGKHGDMAIGDMLKDRDIKARRIAIELIGRGGLDEPVGILMEALRTDNEEEIRVAALKALYHRAGMAELRGILDHLIAGQSQAEIQAAQKTLGALCAREKKMATGDVVIRSALYGLLPDGPSANVTSKVRRMVDSGMLSIDASNQNFGDSAHGIVKSLRVDYLENGVAVSRTVQEGETLRLTASSSPPAIVDAFARAYDEVRKQENTPPALALLDLLGTTESPKAFQIVRSAGEQGRGEIRDKALRVLCDWPTTEALPVVMELVKTSPDSALQMLAFRGAVRLLKQSNDATAERVRHYALLMESADNGDKKKLLLSGLAQVGHVDALEMAFRLSEDDAVKTEAIQAASAIAEGLGRGAREEKRILNAESLKGWTATTEYWSLEDGCIVGHSSEAIPETAYIWSDVEVADFYICVEAKLEPATANSGIQFRSKKINDAGQALGYQGDIGAGVWGRLYHQGGRGKLDWNGRAEEAVKPEDWNRYEILAVGPAIWTAVNGKLGSACLDTKAVDERSGGIAFQLHAGSPQTVRFRVEKLVHDPKIELVGMKADALIAELRIP